MINYKLSGTITALVTPFNKDLSIDFDAFERLVKHQIESKVEGLVICGSTGESATLSKTEKIALIVKALEIADGKIPIIAGTGSNNTLETIDLTILAKEQGANGVLLVAPYYNKPTQEGLYHHYMAIAEKVDIPIIIYNVPGRSGINITAETQLRLAEECSNVIATKEASADLEQMSQIMKYAPEGFNLFSGDDVLTLPIVALGGKGVISVISNYAPAEFSEMTRMALDGKWDKARELHYKLLDLMILNFSESNPTPAKAALALMGMIKEHLRLPLVPITEPNKKLIKTALQEVGLLN
ncbi:MAG: 4-hydroxy-tetrahydrodipicolinate synthase [Ignavibacteriae bacterium HGW-Ignavibacteriae-1]|jgi:4-hydroxy-tetrahydrodipicolinate synthase|nr:MAG: 4-hydroxy-tetrahydrodipicolinate synthase [Ignavibacteriae bacterium HGW-Ignavibacteriae-1]